MNLLITNTQEDQAYLILRCLREVASRIIVTVSADSALQRWGAMSAWSRHVSKRYRVPECSADWRAGIIQSGNTPGEERYVQRIEEICAFERIDCVFPSYDAEVYVFAKNKARLAARGITAVVPDFDGVSRILDKSLTLAAAERVGFPIPRTRVPGNLDELYAAAAELDPPWVLKPRCNAHAVNIRLAHDLPELERYFVELSAIQSRPLLQEFIPTAAKRNYYLLVDRNYELRSVFTPNVHRTRKTGMQMPCAAVVTTREVPFEAEIHSLLKSLGVWGGLTLQSIVDARDNRPKLLEINPRLGRNLWFRTELGINEPQMLWRLAQGEDPGPVTPIEEGVLLLDPLWDLLHLLGQSVDQSLGRLRSRGRGADDETGPPKTEPLGPLLRSFREEYFGPGRRVTCPLNRGYLSDPLPPLARIVRVFVEALIRRAS